jgi:RimJ/RimL family protein N-acetyltransferase
MTGVTLRPVQETDLGLLAANRSRDVRGLDWFGFVPANALHRRFAADGLISDDYGVLVVEAPEGDVVGQVSWFAVRHGPSSACRALNIGISMLPERRNRGYGSAAQRALAEYLFATTLIERVEASTDVDNVAEQRALEKAGFAREGVLRHAQFRDGQWRDVVLYSVLRAEVFVQ